MQKPDTLSTCDLFREFSDEKAARKIFPPIPPGNVLCSITAMATPAGMTTATRIAGINTLPGRNRTPAASEAMTT